MVIFLFVAYNPKIKCCRMQRATARKARLFLLEQTEWCRCVRLTRRPTWVCHNTVFTVILLQTKKSQWPQVICPILIYKMASTASCCRLISFSNFIKMKVGSIGWKRWDLFWQRVKRWQIRSLFFTSSGTLHKTGLSQPHFLALVFFYDLR